VVSNQVISFLHTTETTLIAAPIRHALAALHKVFRNPPLSPEQRSKLLQEVLLRKLSRAVFYQLLNVLKAFWRYYGGKRVWYHHPLLRRIVNLRATQFLPFAVPDVVTSVPRVSQNPRYPILIPSSARNELYALAV
jgi:hypothetical protein